MGNRLLIGAFLLFWNCCFKDKAETMGAEKSGPSRLTKRRLNSHPAHAPHIQTPRSLYKPRPWESGGILTTKSSAKGARVFRSPPVDSPSIKSIVGWVQKDVAEDRCEVRGPWALWVSAVPVLLQAEERSREPERQQNKVSVGMGCWRHACHLGWQRCRGLGWALGLNHPAELLYERAGSH